MTTLIVVPIDMAAKGSHAKRKKVQRAYADMQRALQTNDVVGLVGAYDAIETMVAENLKTDDGTPVAEALEQASEYDYQVLMRGLLGGETIPNPSSAT